MALPARHVGIEVDVAASVSNAWSAAEVPADPEVQLLGRAARRGGEPLDRPRLAGRLLPRLPVIRPTDHRPRGEQYARGGGIRELVVVPIAQPCGCLIDGHVTRLHAGAPALELIPPT